MVLFHVLMGRLLLLEHVGFHLVHGGGHLHKLAQIDEPVRVEVGHPNGPQLPGLVGPFQHAVGVQVVVHRVVEDHQVDGVHVQAFQRVVDGGLVLVEGGAQLGLQEDVLPLDPGLFQAPAHLHLVAVAVGGVNQLIAVTQGKGHVVGDLLPGLADGAVAQHGHFQSILQRRVFHCESSSQNHFL